MTWCLLLKPSHINLYPCDDKDLLDKRILLLKKYPLKQKNWSRSTQITSLISSSSGLMSSALCSSLRCTGTRSWNLEWTTWRTHALCETDINTYLLATLMTPTTTKYFLYPRNENKQKLLTLQLPSLRYQIFQPFMKKVYGRNSEKRSLNQPLPEQAIRYQVLHTAIYISGQRLKGENVLWSLLGCQQDK